MKILDNDFMVCTDCLMAIANDDYTGLDYYYSPGHAEQRKAEIISGIESAGGYISCGDSDRDEEFSSRSCDCCGYRLAGSRTHCIVMGVQS